MKKLKLDDTSSLTQLGQTGTTYDHEPDMALLETFANQYPEGDYRVQYTTKEFTSLCPKTGQPDFATITILYVPNALCVETKSLKIYLHAYRNVGSFMETITNRILNDFVAICQPKKCTVVGNFAARGGIVIDVEAKYEEKVAS